MVFHLIVRTRNCYITLVQFQVSIINQDPCCRASYIFATIWAILTPWPSRQSFMRNFKGKEMIEKRISRPHSGENWMNIICINVAQKSRGVLQAFCETSSKILATPPYMLRRHPVHDKRYIRTERQVHGHSWCHREQKTFLHKPHKSGNLFGLQELIKPHQTSPVQVWYIWTEAKSSMLKCDLKYFKRDQGRFIHLLKHVHSRSNTLLHHTFHMRVLTNGTNWFFCD